LLFFFAVQISQHEQPRDVIDFMLETITSHNQKPIGEFLEQTKPPVEDVVVTAGDGANEADQSSWEKSFADSNDCEKHVVYHKFSASTKQDEKVEWNWTISSSEARSANDSIGFR